MFTRKSVFVALTVVAMLAMLVPAAMAAPELVTGVSIQAPTEGDPVWVSSPGSFDVEYTVMVAGQQVTPVEVTFQLINEYNRVVEEHMVVIPVGALSTGANELTFEFAVPRFVPDGYYHLRVCVDDFDDPYCTTERRAVRVDSTAPEPVVLERPGVDNVCVWVTGTEYELFGYAIDNWAVAEAWFEYTLTPDRDNLPNDEALVIEATPVDGFPGEYSAVWDSSEVPDTTPGAPGYMQFCAEDEAGNVACSGFNAICIENRVKIDLEKGWNLISTPLLLYEPAISDVLENIWCPRSDPSCVDDGGWKYPADGTPIDMIYTTRDGGATWRFWKDGAPDGVQAIHDGYGYWVHAVAPARIEFIGTWLSIGPIAPPEYPVQEGWNLIGYTHWGTPTDQRMNQTAAEYLGWPMVMSVESMYRYDARIGQYIMVFGLDGMGEDEMMQGAGYWLALSEGGTINP